MEEKIEQSDVPAEPDIIVLSEPSGRQIIGFMLSSEGPMIQLANPMLFAEQKTPGEDGRLKVGMAFMPLLFTEQVDFMQVMPASLFFVEPTGKLAVRYKEEVVRYQEAMRVAKSGIIVTNNIQDGLR